MQQCLGVGVRQIQTDAGSPWLLPVGHEHLGALVVGGDDPVPTHSLHSVHRLIILTPAPCLCDSHEWRGSISVQAEGRKEVQFASLTTQALKQDLLLPTTGTTGDAVQ